MNGHVEIREECDKSHVGVSLEGTREAAPLLSGGNAPRVRICPGRRQETRSSVLREVLFLKALLSAMGSEATLLSVVKCVPSGIHRSLRVGGVSLLLEQESV